MLKLLSRFDFLGFRKHLSLMLDPGTHNFGLISFLFPCICLFGFHVMFSYINLAYLDIT